MAQTPCEYRKPGQILAYLATGDKLAGEVVTVGTRPLIVVNAIDFSLNPIGSVYSDGVFDIPQAAEIIQAGDRVYWDANGNPYGGTALSGAATATASGNNLIGTATPISPNGTADTTATDTYVRVDIDGTSLNIATVAGAVTATDITGSDSTLTVAGIAAAQGGLVSVTGGVSSTTGNHGGAVSLVGGVGGATGNGGAAAVTGGASAAGATGTGGAVTVTGGANANTTNGAGGAVTTTGGAGKGSGAGGGVAIVGGASAGSGAGGNITVTPGASGSGIAGGVILRGDTFFAQDAPSAESTGAQAIAAADFVNGIVVHTVAAASALSTPTGAQIAAVLPAGVTTGDAFRLHVITVGAGADDISTLTAGDGDVTFVGNVTVGPDDGTSATNGYGTWIFRMTGATSFVGYRVG